MATRLAVIGDLHYSAVLTNNALGWIRDKFYEELLESFFACDADFHIALGDVTHSGHPSEWALMNRRIEELCRKYGRTFRYVLGNHDTLSQSKTAVQAQTRQARHFVEETPDCRLIFLDTTRETSPDDWGGVVDEAQLEWLSGLAHLPYKTTLVFGHHPFPKTTWASDEPMMSISNAEEVIAVLSAAAPAAVYFNGHNHVHSIARGWTYAPKWTFVQCAAALSASVFRTVVVSERDVVVETVHCQPALTQLAQSYQSTLDGYMNVSAAVGTKSDQNVRVVLTI